MTTRHRTILLASAAVATAMTPGMVAAQTTPSSDVPATSAAGMAEPGEVSAEPDVEAGREIVVTARRVNESLQRTPIAITALGADQLRDRQVASVADLSSVVPSLHVTGGSAGSASNAQFFIRGVGQSDFLPTADPAVGVYIDGVYIARTTGNLFDLADVAQIEVLRGPQGTLFGKNTSGGAISVTTKRPTNDFSAVVEGTLGNYWRRDIKGAVSGALIRDQLGASLTAVSRNEDGWGYNRYLDRHVGNINMQSVRGSLNYFGSSAFDYYLTADYTRRRERSRPFAIVGIYPSGTRDLYQRRVVDSQYPGLSYTSALMADDPHEVYTGGPDANDLDVGGVSGIGTWKVSPDFSIKSITAFRAQRALTQVDYDGSPLPIADYEREIHQSQVSQELQFNLSAFDGRLNLVGGGFFQHEWATIDNYQPTLKGLYDVLVVSNPAQKPFGIRAHVRQTNDSYAGYANATFEITDRLGVTAGIRYSSETKDFSQVADYLEASRSIFVTATGGTLPAGTKLQTQRTFNSTTPTAGIQFQAARNAFFYFTYAKGFKSGGFDARPLAGLVAPSAFEPETVTSYEAGGKFDLFDRKLRLNLAAYSMSYNDLQVTAVQSQPSGVSVNITRNAGRARIRGVELETVFEPTPGLQVQGNASYTDARLREIASGVPFTIDDKLVNTPEWIVNLGVQYKAEMSDGSTLTPRIDYAYSSSVYNELPNTYGLNAAGTAPVANGPLDLPTKQPPYSLVNARLAWSSDAADTWTVALFATNLFDKRYKTYGFSSLGVGYSLAYYGAPREFGLTVTRRFQ
ncbi:TonB-dependent receptor [Tsuneonella suprasediminis]|uniref:TonB-dependent receptor n=1 Tax=Tsuneonella suprasediminis TaxID=2306996 RepID=A0A419R459_9SPHN|nr:TonB-dependent receptor [Tsuneonella suprasediminis]RJX69122.1 TonB-dependent receptor [Tsuneonella suprasediminis]